MAAQSKQDLKVVIVGAGLGGLMTAILLERAGIAYTLLERASTVKPLGSVLTLNANILPVFKQLGLLGDLYKISLPMKEINMYNDKLQSLGTFDVQEYAPRTGYDSVSLSRPELYDILLGLIPKEKVLFNKKVLDVKQENDHATVICGDESEYEADIVIGADGAYSVVRQVMFRDLSEAGSLPASDKEDMKTVSIGLYGITDELDPKDFPDVAGENCKFVSVAPGYGAHLGYTSMIGNRFSWGMGVVADTEEAKKQKFAAAAWNSEQAEDMIKMASDFKIPEGAGGTLGALIAKTPRDRISKVLLEEKLYESWFHDRVVLVGDACHKMTPGGGQGAVNAMQDAVVLVNCISNLDKVTLETLKEAFKDYMGQRYERAKKMIAMSRQLQDFLFAQTTFERMVRWAVLHLVPAKMRSESFIAEAVYQPQVNFLPLAVGNPDFKVTPQTVLQPYGVTKAV